MLSLQKTPVGLWILKHSVVRFSFQSILRPCKRVVVQIRRRTADPQHPSHVKWERSSGMNRRGRSQAATLQWTTGRTRPGDWRGDGTHTHRCGQAALCSCTGDSRLVNTTPSSDIMAQLQSDICDVIHKVSYSISHFWSNFLICRFKKTYTVYYQGLYANTSHLSNVFILK